MNTDWISDSSILCSSSPGIMASLRMTVTSTSSLKGSASEAVSYDRPIVQLSANALQYAPKAMDARVLNLGLWKASLQSRLGETAQESSLWVSSTSVKTLVARGSQHSSKLVLTVGSVAGSGSMVMSYDGPSVHYGHEEIDEGVRIEGVPWSRSGVGIHISLACVSTRGLGKF